MQSALSQLLIELGPRNTILECRPIGAHAHRYHMLRVESGRHLRKLNKTTYQQPRRHQKRQRNGKLCNPQRPAQPVVPETQPSVQGTLAAAFQICREIDTRSTHRWSEAKDDSSDNGDGK